MRIDTWDQKNQATSEIDSLPSEEQTYWLVDTQATRDVSINNHDEKYCFDCYYMIGVYSKNENIKYQIIVE
jgi:hypothetical protein